MGFPGGSVSKESACNAGDLTLIPGLGRSPRGGHGSPPQYSCLKNPHGQRSYGPWGRKELDQTESLNAAQHKHEGRRRSTHIPSPPSLFTLCLDLFPIQLNHTGSKSSDHQVLPKSKQLLRPNGGSDDKEPVCNAGDAGSIPESGRFPQRRGQQPTPVFLPGEFHGQLIPFPEGSS